ncbi:hypothetical protein MEG05_03550 [Vibrio aestuarianus]|uniref:hypothetical protein n=1 Tax=Vibrio aestuarianus TaxID=28171 RepID=UPI00237C6524|nr:hypothetical protein [Vibrio aestuarianus]MDE1313374.1 hypothetical protein [Vibrio aestuarianus]
MDKNEQENRLELKAKNELQKTQQLAESDFVKGQLKKMMNNKLRKDIVIRDDLLKGGSEPTRELNDKITGRQEALDELVAIIDLHQGHLLSTYDLAKLAIAELRKFNRRKANELENSLALKVKQTGSTTIKKKRL